MVKVHYVIKKVPWAFFSLCTSKVINNNGPLLHSLIHFSKPMVNSSQWPCLKEVIVFPEILVGSCWSAAPFCLWSINLFSENSSWHFVEILVMIMFAFQIALFILNYMVYIGPS